MQYRSNDIGEVFFSLCKSIDSPVSLGRWLRYKYSQELLATDSISVSDYLHPNDFFGDYVCSEYLSKYEGLKTNIDTKAVALHKFKTCEEMNLITNKRLRAARELSTDSSVESVFHTARRIIANILGPLNRDKVLGSPGWSPGSTATLSRIDARVDTKMLEVPISVTRKCLPLARRVIADDLHWCASLLGHFPEGPFCFLPNVFEIVDWNRVVTVPKNAKTDRVIAAEPTMNIFFQKSVGAYIRRRLRSHGVDLNDQSVNQDAAKVSWAMNYATIDLSSASDTISLELIYDLLPLDWFFLLDDLRSPKGKIGDEVITYQKFSSMGNGFTFELESMIFFALTSAILSLNEDPRPVFVYGDDIIAPCEYVSQITNVFAFCGFSLNREKSHFESAFRESCGKHYFQGKDVTPPYQKQVPDALNKWVAAGNRLIRTLHDTSFWKSSWLACRRIGGGQQYAIPYGVSGDDGWAVPLCDFRPVKGSRNHGFKCRVFRLATKRVQVTEAAYYAYALRQKSEKDEQDVLAGSISPSQVDRYGTVAVGALRRLKPSTRWVQVDNLCSLDF